jgi:hypothetical protein
VFGDAGVGDAENKGDPSLDSRPVGSGAISASEQGSASSSAVFVSVSAKRTARFFNSPAGVLSALARFLFTARFFTTVKASSEEKVSSETESFAPREERRRFFTPVDPDASFSFAAFFPRR